ncbi:amino acid transporter-like protein [Hyaloscypha variabilis F]|uniref:Amino acid transporter-like protein n=1 Tax=Hyaloscypha variabilis (strain UAMH 11265 / GT02V1 / F) TaxID=1149755 RepID=A0A2J6RH72_HYAVF|nr:amino acid transporter-like protein [Hyaloscypha variabilis F]
MYSSNSIDKDDKMSSEKPTTSSPSDEETLQAPEIGYTEELRRDFSIWSLGSLCLCLMGTWEALTSVVAAALTNGGAPCLFYNYIITFLGTIAVACSLAEIASIWPTAGGQYHWVHALAPPSQKRLASWFTGLISIGGQIVLTASAAFAAGLQFQALITLNNPDSYVPARWQGMLFYWLVLLYSAAVNIWGSKVLPHTNLASGVIHVVGFVAIMLVMGIMAPKHSAHFVFVEFSNTSGWSNDGVSWLVGLLSTVYPFLGYDAACHLAEEMPRPARNVPLAMVGSVLVNGVMGLGFAIMLLFSLGDLNDLLTSPLGFPYMQLFLNITQNRAGATMLVLIVSLVAVAANAAGCTSTSRTFWAFARDDATPCSKLFSRVSPRLKVPVPAIVAVTVVQMLLGLLYLGNSTAFNAVLSMAILGMYASYILPIVYMLVYGRRKLGKGEFGPFNLGRAGMLLNAVAVGWLVVAMVFSTFPSLEPVTSQNMNYAVVVMGGWLVIGTVYFFGWGRKKYVGPVV